MKLKSTLVLPLLLVTLIFVTNVSGSIVTLTTVDANGTQGNSNVGTFTITTSTSGNSLIYSFIRTANMDGGTVNDTLSFDLIYTMYTGSTFDGTDVTLGTSVALADFSNPHYMNNYVGDSNTNALAPGDSFTASIANIQYTSGEGFSIPAVSFNGFNSLSKFGGGDDDVFLGTTGASTIAVSSANGAVQLGGVTDLTLTTALTSGTSNQRWRDLNFSFTVPFAVPEPSSLALLAASSFAMIVRRRR